MRLALHGPLYSGKTALAKQLESAHGFRMVNYTDYLKELGVRALEALGIHVTVEEIRANKGFYRTFLQGLGTVVGFDEGGFVEECLLEQGIDPQVYYSSPYPPASKALAENIVFDNVRAEAQFKILKLYGFELVRLDVPPELQRERAHAQGISHEQFAAAASHAIEQPIPHQPGEIQMLNNGEFSIPDIADHLVSIDVLR